MPALSTLDVKFVSAPQVCALADRRSGTRVHRGLATRAVCHAAHHGRAGNADIRPWMAARARG
eukprot:5307649-Prymnesium_polylepis.1